MPRGYNASADVMRVSADGRDLNELFAELRAVADLQNESRQRFIDLFTYPVTSPVTTVLQTLGSSSGFQEATEYGVPTSSRNQPASLNMGATFKWYDNAWRSTWQYLADATATEIEANAQATQPTTTSSSARSWARSSGTPTAR